VRRPYAGQKSARRPGGRLPSSLSASRVQSPGVPLLRLSAPASAGPCSLLAQHFVRSFVFLRDRGHDVKVGRSSSHSGASLPPVPGGPSRAGKRGVYPRRSPASRSSQHVPANDVGFRGSLVALRQAS